MVKKIIDWRYFALLAALCNASIGFFSKAIFKLGLTPAQVAFYKCLIAFLLLSIINLNKRGIKNIIALAPDWWKIALCAFFGVFTLYFFETSAYNFIQVPTVVFLLLGASCITTFVMSYFIIKENLSILSFIGFALSIVGLALVFNENKFYIVSAGGSLAIIAGCGYGLFLSLVKKLSIDTSEVAFLWWFVGFGIFFLSVPFLIKHPSLPSVAAWPTLILLGIIPTIGGYYCTAKALFYGRASQVQLFELTEPIFATLFSLLFFEEFLNSRQIVGAVCILSAIYLSAETAQNNFIFLKKHLTKT